MFISWLNMSWTNFKQEKKSNKMIRTYLSGQLCYSVAVPNAIDFKNVHTKVKTNKTIHLF